jgi:hypothetical protein
MKNVLIFMALVFIQYSIYAQYVLLSGDSLNEQIQKEAKISHEKIKNIYKNSKYEKLCKKKNYRNRDIKVYQRIFNDLNAFYISKSKNIDDLGEYTRVRLKKINSYFYNGNESIVYNYQYYISYYGIDLEIINEKEKYISVSLRFTPPQLRKRMNKNEGCNVDAVPDYRIFKHLKIKLRQSGEQGRFIVDDMLFSWDYY